MMLFPLKMYLDLIVVLYLTYFSNISDFWVNICEMTGYTFGVQLGEWEFINIRVFKALDVGDLTHS